MKKTLLLTAIFFFLSSLLKVLPFGESRWLSGLGGAFNGGASAQTIAAGSFYSLALCNDGTVRALGRNTYGNLGDGTVTQRLTPVQVKTGASGCVTYLCNITALAAGDQSLALKSDGTLWAWGWNANGQLGDGTTATKLTPVQVSGLTGITAVSAGAYYSLARKSDGTVWAWGYNNFGQLGDNTNTQRLTPVQVHGSGNVGFLTGITAVSAGMNTGGLGEAHSLALKSDGTVWAWGLNNRGQLGDGTNTNRTTPVQVSGLTGITAVSAGMYYSLALKSDGTVWAWGFNWYNDLGDGTNTDRWTPVQVHGPGNVGFLTGMKAVAAGMYHALALKNDGTVWAWGNNGSGQLGQGTWTNSTTPLQVLTGASGCSTYLCNITSIAAGYEHSLALKNDGTLWAWGGNGNGALGDNTVTYRTTPVQTIGLCTVMMPLPIELLSFDASPVQDNNEKYYVSCQWSTASEINNDYFTIERSQDGKIFSDIGLKKGAGNSNTTLYYEFDDQLPYTGLSYYRLKQVDYNGAFTYSQIRAVYIGTFGLITIYPNPSTDGSIQYIVASEAGGVASVNVYDVLGRTVISNTETLEGGVATKKLSTASLSSGSYLLQITNDNLEKTQKQFVIK
ncbi:MAG: T9SS type A sorting domain-containing protein [Bacteroidetes bacterium]|nr:T9SS type A sorting domain-containing protein [Bacteroidota bacterium]